MKQIRFLEEGNWADPINPRIAHITPKVGDIAFVSDELAEIAIEAKKAVEVKEEAAPKIDKSRAEGNPAHKDKRKANKR